MNTKRDPENNPAKDAGDVSEGDLAKAEAPLRVEQDAAVEAMKKLPQDTEAGSTEPPKDLIKDG